MNSELNDTQLIIYEKDIKKKYSLSESNHNLTHIFQVLLQFLELKEYNPIRSSNNNKILIKK